MTPRSRKPVIIGGMRGLASETYHPNFIDFQMDDEVGHSFEYCQHQQTPDQHHTSLHRSKSENSLLCRSPIESTTQAQLTTELIPPPSATLIKSTSDETLSTPFRYLFLTSHSTLLWLLLLLLLFILILHASSFGYIFFSTFVTILLYVFIWNK